MRHATLVALVDICQQAEVDGELIDNLYWSNRTNCKDVPVCVNAETANRCAFLRACERDVAVRLPLEFTRYY